jgi:hypothetical protein
MSILLELELKFKYDTLWFKFYEFNLISATICMINSQMMHVWFIKLYALMLYVFIYFKLSKFYIRDWGVTISVIRASSIHVGSNRLRLPVCATCVGNTLQQK